MDRKFGVKVQKLGGEVKDNATLFSAPLVIEPEDNISARRGSLYATIEVASGNEFDPNLVVKVTSDIFQNEYFNNPNGTPLSCLEKSVTVIRDKVFNLLQDPKIASSGTIEFHAVISVLWGSVLYVVQYGNGCSYLIRDGKAKPINTSSEGNFSVASGVVKDGDVVILGSKGFCEKYSYDTLLTSVSTISQSPDVSAVLLKFEVEKGPVSSTSEVLDIRDTATAPRIRVRRGGTFFTKRRMLFVFALVVGVVLLFSIFNAFKDNKFLTQESGTAESLRIGREKLDEASKYVGLDDVKAREILTQAIAALEEANKKLNSEEITALIAELKAKLNQANKVKEVDDITYYDIRVDDKDANPTELVVVSATSALVVEEGRNKFYSLVLPDNPSLKVVESTQTARPRHLSPTPAGAVFLEPHKAYFEYDSGNGKISQYGSSDDYKTTDVTDAYSYIGNVYAITDAGQIFKNNSVWATVPLAATNGASLAIDGSIYVITSPGELTKYTSGVKDTFSVKELDKPFFSAIQVYTTADLANLYILDKGNLRVVVLDKEGKFKAQYVLKDGSRSWEGATSISVSLDEKVLYLLSGSKIYKIML